MTVDEGSEDAHTDSAGAISDRLDDYLEVLEKEREAVESIQSDLEEHPDEEHLTREEYRQIFPRTMPMEEWGGFRG